MIVIVISNNYTMIYLFSLPSINNLGLFDKIMPMKNGLWILIVGTGLLTLPMKLGLLILLVGNWVFDIANENWIFDIANENWVFDTASGD